MYKLTKPPYRSPENNIWYTEALFYNRAIEKPKGRWPIEPLFDLYDDRPGLVNCRTTFVALKDPTGRKWALTYLGDWTHWLRLMRCPWFREAYESWIVELNLQLKSEAINKIMELMSSENPSQALAAAKFIATKGYDQTPRGRPSKAEVDGEVKRAAEALAVEDEDMQRIGLKVIEGGKRGN